MDKITINDFTELIMYRVPLRAKNSKGQVVESWTNYRKALVRIDAGNSDEFKEGEKIFLPGTLTISAHNESFLTNTWRISYLGDEYNILSITPTPNRMFVSIRATKIFD